MLATGTNHRGLNVKMAIGHWKSPALVASRSMSATPWGTWGKDTRLEHTEKGLPGAIPRN